MEIIKCYSKLTDTKKKEYIKKINNDEKIKIEIYKKSLIEETEDLIGMFNTVLLNITSILEKEYKNDIKINIYTAYMKNIINNKHKEPISVFLVKVYSIDKYRTNILKKNDNFFLDEDNHKDHLSSNNISKMFLFKDYWTELNNNVKIFIKNSFVTMVKICEKYIDFKSSINDVIEFNSNYC